MTTEASLTRFERPTALPHCRGQARALGDEFEPLASFGIDKRDPRDEPAHDLVAPDPYYRVQ